MARRRAMSMRRTQLRKSLLFGGPGGRGSAAGVWASQSWAAAMATDMPPAEAPAMTLSETSCRGQRGSSPRFPSCHWSRAWIRKSTTPAVYAPAETAPAITRPISKPPARPAVPAVAIIHALPSRIDEAAATPMVGGRPGVESSSLPRLRPSTTPTPFVAPRARWGSLTPRWPLRRLGRRNPRKTPSECLDEREDRGRARVATVIRRESRRPMRSDGWTRVAAGSPGRPARGLPPPAAPHT